jgi:hypothetical protein
MPVSIESENITSISLSNQTKCFLATLESARDLLARRLVLKYHELLETDLNYTIHSSILQIIFLKTGQDCGFVEPGTLAILADTDGIGKRMVRACSDVGLSQNIFFYKGPDAFHPIPAIPDDVLRQVIHLMDSAEFPVPIFKLPIEELVVAFEYFTGTRMQIAEGYRVKRIGKSAVFYTGSVDVPTQPVIEYVVREIIGHSSRDAKAANGTGIRIIDPACGAGIFLLAAYRALVRRKTDHSHLLKQSGEVLRDLVCQSVHGVDIDAESVSAARFVILLSFIEEWMLSGSGRISPDRLREICACLIGSIRCGNALIAPDYFSGLQEHPFNADERCKVNAFSWHEAFPIVFEAGGFDVVIGAPPPYRPFIVKERNEYFQTHYDVYEKGAGLYSYFIEKGLQILRPEGSLAFCIPDTFLRINHSRPLRRFLLKHQILEIIKTGKLRQLEGKDVGIYLLRIAKRPVRQPVTISVIDEKLDSITTISRPSHHFTIDQSSLGESGWTLRDTRVQDIVAKVRCAGPPLEEVVMGRVHYGIITGLDEAFVIDARQRNEMIEASPKSKSLIRPFLLAGDIIRYGFPHSSRFIIFIPQGWTTTHAGDQAGWSWFRKKYPAITRHLKSYAERAKARKHQGNFWWECANEPDVFDRHQSRIIFYGSGKSTAFTFDTGEVIPDYHTRVINSSSLYILAVLNSQLCTFILRGTSHEAPEKKRAQIWEQIAALPIYTPDFDNPNDKSGHDRMVSLVTEMLELHKHLSNAKTDQEKRLVTQEIESTDRQIDSLVYGLYGLTADEIAVVEESVGK